ncbi:MAG: hypothetical protein R3B09_28590 [Nannocystaceae bacterium]
MPKAFATWTVHPHKAIERLEDNLWRAQGVVPGMSLRRVMTIARRSDGRLVIHNAIALDEAMMAEIDAWGEVGFILVPNGYHRLDAPSFKARYPQAKVLCPRGSREKVAEVVPVDGAYEDFPADPEVALETLDGVGAIEGVMTVKSPSGHVTVVFNDAVFNMPHGTGFTGFVFRHLTQSTGGPRISRVVKLFVIKDKAAFRAHLGRLSELPGLYRMIVSHHRTVEGDAAAALQQAIGTL